jgi:prepilin-type N-terminal cleavage/methylation domain-containing protein
MNGGASRSGVTLIEMLIVVTIVGLIAGVTFPAVSSGIDSLRLASASDALVSLLNGALNRAERRQEPIEVAISVKDNSVRLSSTEPGFERNLTMPDGVKIVAVWPKLLVEDDQPRRFLLLPGSVVPRVGIEIVNRKETHRIVRVNPITGVPNIERPGEQGGIDSQDAAAGDSAQ